MPFLKVTGPAFVGVGFALETDTAVRHLPVSGLQEAVEEFGSVPDIKWDDQHFDLLAEVDPFVLQQHGIVCIGFPANDDEREKRDAAVAFGDEMPVDDDHVAN